ncbi:MAG: hypothetical protein HQK54_16310, partial [Oligoflexales bacterium]|nr:hypothetical protein [Oligoflexales bacterium]
MNLVFAKNISAIIAVTAVIFAVSMVDIRSPGRIDSILMLKNPDDSFRVEDVISAPQDRWEEIESRRPHLTLSFSPSTSMWFKIDLEKYRLKPSQYVLEVDFPILPFLDFYLVEGGKVKDVHRTGIGEKQIKTDYLPINYKTNFIFSPDSQVRSDIYIKVHGKRVLVSFPLTIMAKDEYVQVNRLKFLALSLFQGGLLCIILYNFIIYLSIREKTYLYYVAYHISTLIFGLIFAGFGRFTLLEDNFTYTLNLFNYTFLAIHIFATLFVNEFMNNRELCRPAYLCAKIALLGLILAGVVSIFFPCQIGFAIIMAFSTFAQIIYYVGLVFAMNIRPRVGFFSAWALLVASAMITNLSHFGLFPSFMVAGSIGCFGLICEALYLSFALGERIKNMMAEKEKITEALSSYTSRAKFNEVFGQVYNYRSEVMRRRVSIVFVDIAGFTEISEKIGSLKAFHYLKKTTEIIHGLTAKYLGIVDRSLGDGVLAVFGLEDELDKDNAHVNRAFLFAVEMQKHVASVTIEEKIPIPMRIGIHVDSVFIGNLGGSRRLDYTIVGEGVNFASRLESSCTPFLVRLSEQAKSHLDVSSFAAGAMRQVVFQIKNVDRFLKAYEYNPHHENCEMLSILRNRYLSFLERTIDEERILVKNDREIILSSQLGRFRVVEFSPGGFGVTGDVFLSQKMTVSVDLVFSGYEAGNKMKEKLAGSFHVEVCWGYWLDDGVVRHGFKMVGCNERRKLFIFEEMKRSLEAKDGLRQSA